MTYVAAFLLVYSWTDCGSGVSCYRFENVVPGIASDDDCKALGKALTADKTDRPRFKCTSYAMAGRS
jgi:hypothetical protein